MSKVATRPTLSHVSKMKRAQQDRSPVVCVGQEPCQELENVFIFKYLGTLFVADDRQCYDIKRRIALTMSRCGSLRHIFASPVISHHLKMRLYRTAICSIFFYGCETWDLSEKTMSQLNGSNSKMISHITGNSPQHEVRPQTTSLNLVRCRGPTENFVCHRV